MKTIQKIKLFTSLLWVGLAFNSAFSQVVVDNITENFDSEYRLGCLDPTNGVALNRFSESGVSFVVNNKLRINKNGRAGVANGCSYLETRKALDGEAHVGEISINTLRTSFKLNSFSAYISSDTSGLPRTQGDIIFTGTAPDGTLFTETVNIGSPNDPSNHTINIEFVDEVTGLKNRQLINLAISLTAGVRYIDIDNFNFSTAALTNEQVYVNNTSIIEGNSDVQTLQFRVNKTSSSAVGSVDYAIIDNTASNGIDFNVTSATGNLILNSGSIGTTLDIDINSNVTIEGNRHFSVVITNPVGLSLFNDSAVVSIIEDDQVVETFEDEIDQSMSFGEGEKIVFSVIENADEFTVEGNLSVVERKCEGAGKSDFMLASPAVGLQSSSNLGGFSINEFGKVFSIRSIDLWTGVIGPNSINPSAATVSIIGTKADGSGEVQYTTPSDATSNFQNISFTGTSLQGVMLKRIRFSILGGTPVTDYLKIDNFDYAVSYISSTQVSVKDAISEEGSGTFMKQLGFSITRSDNTSSFTIDVATSDETALVSDNDYTPLNAQQVQFQAGGDLQKTVFVPVTADETNEPTESLKLLLSNPTNGVLLLDSVGTGIIINDDGYIETFEDEFTRPILFNEAFNFSTFRENGIDFRVEGDAQILSLKESKNFGSNSSNTFIEASLITGNSVGKIVSKTPYRPFIIESIDVWTSNDLGINFADNVDVKFRGVDTSGAELEVIKNINPTNNNGTGWDTNLSFGGTPLENSVLDSLEILIENTANPANYVAFDNFAFRSIDTSPVIEIVDASDNTIPDDGTASNATDTNFGNLCSTANSITKNYTIKNNGSSPLLLTGMPKVVISGGTEFTVTSQPASSVPAGANTTFSVEFTASQTTNAIKNAVLTIPSNDPINSTYIINIAGNNQVGPTPTAGSNTPVCAGQTINLTASGGTGYSWTGPSTFSNATQNPSITNATTAMAGTYTVMVTNAQGCTATATTAVVINDLPTPTAGSNSPVCAGQTINLTASGGTGYSWTGPSTFSSATQNPAITNATAAMAGTYTVTVTNAQGCTATATTTVVVNDLPTPTAVSNSPVCAGQTINLTASGGTGYSWAGPSTFSNATQNPSLTNATVAMAGTYTVTVSNAEGCTATATTEVVVKPTPTAPILSANTPLIVCSPETISISANCTTGSVLWSDNSTTSPLVISTPGSYSVSAKCVLEGCESNSSAPINGIEIGEILPAPTVSNQSACQGSDVTLQATCSSSGSSVVWFSDMAGTNSMSPSLINVQSSTTYYVACQEPAPTSCVGVIVPVQFTVETPIEYPSFSDFSFIQNIYGCDGANTEVALNPFSISGSPLNIQWQINTGGTYADLVNDGTYQEVNNDTLRILNVDQSMENFRYRAEISNLCNTIITDTFELKINLLPTITSEPVGQVVCVGNQIYFNVEADGTGLSYQWQVDNGSGFQNLSRNTNYDNVNRPNLYIKDIPTSFDGSIYRCRVYNTCQEVFSTAVSLQVDPTVTILGQPSDRTACQESDVSFVVNAVNLNSTALNFQWQRSGNGGLTYSNISNNALYSGANSNSLTLSNIPVALDGSMYRCLMDGYCQSNGITLNVIPIATVTSNPINVEICQGNNAQFRVTAAGIGLTYRWQVDPGTGFVDVFDGSFYQGATEATLLLSFPPASINNFKYRCLVSGNSTCDVVADTSSVASISVGISPEAQTILWNSTITMNEGVSQAVGYILAINKIENPDGKAEYRAGNSILLNPGFEVENGGVFKASIRNPCQTITSFGNNKPIPKELIK